MLTARSASSRPSAERALGVAAIAVGVVIEMGEGDERVRGRIIGVDRNRGFGQAASGNIAAAGQQHRLLAASQQELVGLDAGRPLANQPAAFARCQVQLERVHDLSRELVLNVKDVGQLAVESICPDMSAGERIDQLRRHPDAVSRLSHAALEHIADAEIARDLGNEHRLVLVGEGRVASDHVQLGQFRQVGDDVFGDSVGKIFLLGVAAHVLERQHGDRRFGRGTAGWRSLSSEAGSPRGEDSAVVAPRTLIE